MLNSIKLKARFLFNRRGVALVEYVVLLAFVLVLAVFFSTEWDEDYEAFNRNEFKPNNIATGVQRLIYNMRNFLITTKNIVP